MRYFILILLAISLFSNEDLKLVQLAYKSGLKPVPSDFESLLKELNNDSKELSKEKIILGKKLFFDKNLSLDRDISCASCHIFDKGGADARTTAIGHKKQENPFHLNTPTVLNTAFAKKFFWNGRSDTLQDQAKGPLQASFEMSITPELAEKRIYENREYDAMFMNAFSSTKITFDKIAESISAYEKTLVTRGRYDDFLLGYFDILTTEEKQGLKLFITNGCVGCHNGIGLGGQVIRKFPLSYHSAWSINKPINIKRIQKKYKIFLEKLNKIQLNNDSARLKLLTSRMGEKDTALLIEGFFNQISKENVLKVITSSGCTKCHGEKNNIDDSLLKKIAFPFENKGGFLGSKEPKGYFRVPLLRNVVATKPYFHNGSIDKLEDAIKIMGKHQSRVELDEYEIDKIVKFLKAVDGKIIEYLK